MEHKINKYLYKNNNFDLPRDYNLLKLLYNFKKQQGGAVIPSGTQTYLSIYHGHLVSSPPKKLPIGMYLLIPMCCGFSLIHNKNFSFEYLNQQLAKNDRIITYLEQKFILLKPGEYYCDVGLAQHNTNKPVKIPHFVKINDGDTFEGIDYFINIFFSNIIPYTLINEYQNIEYDEILNILQDRNKLLDKVYTEFNEHIIKKVINEYSLIDEKYSSIKNTYKFIVFFRMINDLIKNISEPNFLDSITDYLSNLEIDYDNHIINNDYNVYDRISNFMDGIPNTEEINLINKQNMIDFLKNIDPRYNTISELNNKYTPAGIIYKLEPLLQKLFNLDEYVDMELKLSDLIERLDKKEPVKNKLIISISCQSTPDFCQATKCLSLYKPKRDIPFWQEYNEKFEAFKSAVGLDFSDKDIFYKPIMLKLILKDAPTNKVDYIFNGENKYSIYLKILQMIGEEKIDARKILVLLKKFNPGYIYNLFNIVIEDNYSNLSFKMFFEAISTLMWFLSLDYIKKNKIFPDDILINTIHPRLQTDIENAIKNPKVLKLYKELIYSYADFHKVII